MATHTATRAQHATLTGTTVDKVTLTGSYEAIEVLNRSGTDPLWVTYVSDNVVDSSLPVAPVALADETFYIPAGTGLLIVNDNSAQISWRVKILGNGNSYSVTGQTLV